MGESHKPAKQNTPPQSGEEGWDAFEEDPRKLRADALMELGNIERDEANFEEFILKFKTLLDIENIGKKLC